MEKVLAQGEVGSVKVVEQGGEVKLIAQFGAAVGGVAPGVLKAQASFEVDLEGQAVIDLGLALLAKSFPAVAPMLVPIQAFIDAAIQKA
jgi:hypothetical protein